LSLFSRFLGSGPPEALKAALDRYDGEVRALREAFDRLEHRQLLVEASVDAAVVKVHRELGHVTKRKADLAKLDPPCADEVLPDIVRASRFSGGRRR